MEYKENEAQKRLFIIVLLYFLRPGKSETVTCRILLDGVESEQSPDKLSPKLYKGTTHGRQLNMFNQTESNGIHLIEGLERVKWWWEFRTKFSLTGQVNILDVLHHIF